MDPPESFPLEWGLSDDFVRQYFLPDDPCEGGGGDESAYQGEGELGWPSQMGIVEGLNHAISTPALAHGDRNSALGPNFHYPPTWPNASMSSNGEAQIEPLASVEVHAVQYENYHNLDTNADDFRFESSARVIEDRSRASKKQKPPIDPNALRCEYPGCRSRRTFKRKYELQRHMKKHTDSDKYACPVTSCERVSYRLDKLTLHVEKGHADEDMATCPNNGCTKTLPLGLLFMHFSDRHHSSPFWNVMMKRRAGDYCPITSCGYTRHRWGEELLSNHIQSHTLTERKENCQQIQNAGYNHITGELTCPICRQEFRTETLFRDHVSKSHLISDIGHFLAFKEQFPGIEEEFWELPIRFAYRLVYKCPVCKKEGLQRAEYHRSLLRNPETIRPYRLAILKLWPEFGSHPVFDDIR